MNSPEPCVAYAKETFAVLATNGIGCWFSSLDSEGKPMKSIAAEIWLPNWKKSVREGRRFG